MPCGQRCKEIIDQAYVLAGLMNCMAASILRNEIRNGNGPSQEKMDRFQRLANELGALSQDIAGDMETENRRLTV